MRARIQLAALLAAPARSLVVHDAGESGKARQDACSCLPWADVYNKTDVVCGDAHEFGTGRMGTNLTKEQYYVASTDGWSELCLGFYHKVKEPLCMNFHIGPDWGQWCYVGQECKNLNGGQFMPTRNISWKECAPNQDRMSRPMLAKDLVDIAAKHSVDAALMMKMAYPVFQDMTWEGMQYGLSKSGPNGAINVQAFPEHHRQMVSDALASTTTLVLDSEDHHPPFGIIEKSNVYQIMVNESFFYHPDGTRMSVGEVLSLTDSHGMFMLALNGTGTTSKI